MKQQLYLVLAGLLLLSVQLKAQAPNSFNYQGVARDATGNTLPGQSIGLRFTIHQASENGTTVYRETWVVTTNEFGLFNVAIGSGTVIAGNFSTIGWGSGIYYLQVEMDPAGGNNYLNMGTNQFLSVPYALYAQTSGNGGGGGGVSSVTVSEPLFVTDSTTTPIILLKGAAGTIAYGTGAGSAFSAAGTIGQVLLSGGASAPTWGSANAALLTDSIVSGAGSSVVVTNGANQAVGSSNVKIDVQGTAGGIFYGGGTGSPALFTQAGTTGQILQSNGSAAPTWVTPSSGGSVTSVATGTGLTGGPITTSGTISLANTTVTANSYGDAGNYPTFTVNAQGQLTAAGTQPLPTSLPPSGAAGGDLSGTYPNPTVIALQTIGVSSTAPSNGQVLEYNGTNWAPTSITGGGGGTVTSFSSGDLSPLFTTSVTNSSTTPTQSFTLSDAGAYTLFGNNTNAASVPAYFAPVLASALFSNQGTITTVLHGDASGNPSWGAVNAATDVAGVLGVSNGGTGLSTAGAEGTVLSISSGVPTWVTPSSGGSVTSIATGTGLTGGPITTSGTISLANTTVTANSYGDAGNYPTFTVNAQGQLTAAGTQPLPASLPPSGASGGDLSGTYPNPTVTALQTIGVSSTVPSNGQVLEYNGTNWAPASITGGGGGTVTTFSANDFSPLFNVSVTNASTTPALSFTAIGQTQNLIFASPDGSTGNPTFRALVNSDLPTSGVTATTYGDATHVAQITVNAQGVVTSATSVGITTGGTGTVTSFSSGDLSPLFTTSVTTATSTPTQSFILSNAGAYSILGNNTNVSATPVYFAPVLASALYANQGTTTTVLHGDASGNPSWGAVNAATDLTGILGTTNGGTGLSTVGANGTVLTISAGVPTWVTPGTGGSVTSVATGTGLTGGPITTSGTISIGNTTVTANSYGDASNYPTFTVNAQGQLTAAGTEALPTSLPPSGTASGDLSGLYPDPTVAAIQGIGVSSTSPTTGQVLEYNGTKWVPTTPSSGGSVTSVATGTGLTGGPITTSGTISIANTTVTANSYGDVANYPTFTVNAQGQLTSAGTEALPTSLPPSGSAGGDLSGTYPDPKVTALQTIGISATTPTSGQVLEYNGANWTPTTLSLGGGGTVTSFSSGDLAPLFTTSVTTNTTTPTQSFTLSSAGTYTILGNNTNTSAAPSYFAPTLASALYADQGTTTTVLHGNASGNPSWGAINQATDVTGVLGYANGGTGLSTVGINGTVLTISGGVPTWVTPSTGGTVTSVVSGFGIQGGPITTSGTLSIDTIRKTGVGIPTIYYVDSTVSATAGNGWGIKGNSGTTYGTNYIGTSDNTNLMFKVDKTESGRIENATTANTALGYGGLSNLNTGTENTSVGVYGLYSDADGSNNTALGYEAGFNAEDLGNPSSNNTLIGYNALLNNLPGALNNVTVIGESAEGDTSNSVVLGNHQVTQTDFNGALGVWTGSNYNEGATGQVLQSNGAGAAPTWVSPPAGTAAEQLVAVTEGGTVNTIVGTNIVNPSGGLLGLTITLPSSPANGQCVELKFTQSVLALTYSGGTAAASASTSASQGTDLRLFYDSGTSTWY